MSTQEIIALSTALGLGTLIKTAFDYWLKTKTEKRKRKESFTSVFQGVDVIYKTIQTVLNHSSASRVVVLKTTNGGGIPTLSGTLYSSVMYDVFEKPMRTARDLWQNQIIDLPYVEVLLSLEQHGFADLKTKDLKESILKDLYESQGIKRSLVYKIIQLETKYIYISVNFTEEAEKDESKLSSLCRSAVSDLRHLFSTNVNI